MSRLTSLKRLVIAAFSTCAVVAACRAAQPGEAPPLAPRPEPVSPATAPVPGAPDPLDQPPTPATDARTVDAVPVSQLDPPVFKAQGMPMADAGFVDGGRADAGARDASPPDPNRPDAGSDAGATDASTVDATPVPRLDAGVPDARDGGVGLPPNPDASLPADAVRPM
ncbi:MAG: hypothetical protein JWP01_2618 [Myxococcales bacterium]|nr:hypothetical protein [Myxococcales bacterium]